MHPFVPGANPGSIVLSRNGAGAPYGAADSVITAVHDPDQIGGLGSHFLTTTAAAAADGRDLGEGVITKIEVDQQIGQAMGRGVSSQSRSRIKILFLVLFSVLHRAAFIGPFKYAKNAKKN